MNARLLKKWETEIELCDDTINDCMYVCAITGNPQVFLDNYALVIETLNVLAMHPGINAVKPNLDYSEMEAEFQSKKVDMINRCIWIGYQSAIDDVKVKTHTPTLMRKVKAYFSGILFRYGRMLPDQNIHDILHAMDLFGIPQNDIPTFESIRGAADVSQ